jgi:hypothetical protein
MKTKQEALRSMRASGIATDACARPLSSSSERFTDMHIKRSTSDTADALDRLVECATRGAQVELTLRNGKKIGRFRVHEVIAPTGPQTLPDRRQARVRGIVWPDYGMHRDEYIQVRDIESVRDERLAPYSASEDFFQRHPLPASWIRLARCPAGPKR